MPKKQLATRQGMKKKPRNTPGAGGQGIITNLIDLYKAAGITPEASRKRLANTSAC